MSLSEEEFVALMDVIEATIDAKIVAALDGDSGGEELRASELRQDFIDIYIFGDTP